MVLESYNKFDIDDTEAGVEVEGGKTGGRGRSAQYSWSSPRSISNSQDTALSYTKNHLRKLLS